jgi:hypothetical protein
MLRWVLGEKKCAAGELWVCWVYALACGMLFLEFCSVPRLLVQSERVFICCGTLYQRLLLLLLH